MDLKLATTRDIIDELNRRDIDYIFVGTQATNRPHSEIYYACRGRSRREMLQLIRLFERQLKRRPKNGTSE